jgi:DNA-binding NtrC family response regulator
MLTNSILLQNLSAEQLTELMTNIIRIELSDFKKELNTQTVNDELMSREQVLTFLQINPSTLYRWTNNKRINVYKFSGKCFYKRAELMDSITLLKK